MTTDQGTMQRGTDSGRTRGHGRGEEGRSDEGMKGGGGISLGPEESRECEKPGAEEVPRAHSTVQYIPSVFKVLQLLQPNCGSTLHLPSIDGPDPNSNSAAIHVSLSLCMSRHSTPWLLISGKGYDGQVRTSQDRPGTVGQGHSQSV